MLQRTHLAIGLGVALYFLDVSILNNKLIFFIVVMIASLLPDLENGFLLKHGRGEKISRIIRKLSPTKGFLHTYTFCILVSLILAFIYPIAAFPFFVGYSFHLFTDSFTPEGIRPFWPFKGESKGYVSPGGKIDHTIFYVIAIVDFALLVKLFL